MRMRLREGFCVLMILIASIHVVASQMTHHKKCLEATIAECFPGEELFMESEASYRFLAEARVKSISYGALTPDKGICKGSHQHTAAAYRAQTRGLTAAASLPIAAVQGPDDQTIIAPLTSGTPGPPLLFGIESPGYHYHERRAMNNTDTNLVLFRILASIHAISIVIAVTASSSPYTPVENIALDCGSHGHSTAPDGRKWTSDTGFKIHILPTSMHLPSPWPPPKTPFHWFLT
ncbi:hypothetical protein CK203_094599 [Vitis vinifera]|uniref:Uncharacterized protein n=1 Tax=Vitis vinifera TaxID=29760 RepID=A0A438E379_VITVI|nr:hypothetical protein CK203_094599 [Vitis vinifera]